MQRKHTTHVDAVCLLSVIVKRCNDGVSAIDRYKHLTIQPNSEFNIRSSVNIQASAISGPGTVTYCPVMMMV